MKKLKVCSTLTTTEMQADYVQILEGLARKGHGVHTYLHTPTTTWNPGIPSLTVYPTRERGKLDRVSIVNRMSLDAARRIRQEDIDVVYATGTRLGEGLVAAKLTNRPVLCDVRNPWSIQWKDFVKRISLRTTVGNQLRKLRYRMEEQLIYRADSIVAYSQGIKRWLCDHLGLQADKIVVIPPHVDTGMFHPGVCDAEARKQLDVGKSRVLMYVGAITHSRGIDLLIKAFYKVHSAGIDAKLVLIGPQEDSVTPYIEDLKAEICTLGLENDVILTGYVPFSEVPAYTAVADVCVIPHRPNFTYEISPPVKTLEYMASQKPIVTTDVGIRDFIAHERTGLIVEPNDAFKLSQAICSLLDNQAFAQELAENARDYVTCHLREELMVDKFEELLGEISRNGNH